MKSLCIPALRQVSVFGLGVCFLASCSSPPPKPKEEQFRVVSPLVTDTVYTHEYVAEISALQNVEVRTRIKGFIESIQVDEGQVVRKGQVLFSISSKEYHQQWLKARAATKSVLAELKSSEIELENTRKLLEKNIIAKTEYDLAAAKVEALKAKVEEAEAEEARATLNLSFAEVRAPFDGIINRIPNKTGSLVEEGQLLTTISNTDEVLVYFNLSEKEYLDHVTSLDRTGREKVELVLANGLVFQHPGMIETSESEFDRTTGNIAFRARFPNPEGLLKHGANGKILLRKPLKSAMLIPQKSTFEIQDKVYVYVLKNDSTVEQRNVEIRLRLPHMFAIESGLSGKEKILYEGVENVTDGMKISPVHMSEINNTLLSSYSDQP